MKVEPLRPTSDKTDYIVGTLCTLAVLATWWAAFNYAPVDANQGEVYRIMFLHVPSAISAFAAALVLFVFSLWNLFKHDENAVLGGKAAAEVGLLFTVLALATGSIWGRPTWGTWWTWDARLTTTFLLALLYCGYLMLHASMAPGAARAKACGVLGSLIFVDVPVIYKSVTWWRTLHQPPSMLREGGSTMDPEILRTLIAAIVALIVYGFWLGWQRAKNLRLRDDVESASFEQLRP